MCDALRNAATALEWLSTSGAYVNLSAAIPSKANHRRSEDTGIGINKGTRGRTKEALLDDRHTIAAPVDLHKLGQLRVGVHYPDKSVLDSDAKLTTMIQLMLAMRRCRRTAADTVWDSTPSSPAIAEFVLDRFKSTRTRVLHSEVIGALVVSATCICV